MRPLIENVPIWLCRWERATKFIWARSAGSAAALCELCGLGRPSSVSYSGYSAEPGQMVRPKGMTRRTVSLSRRAEAALAIYSMLRIDWPVGSILSSMDAERRWQASNAALRDFIANVGTVLVHLTVAERGLVGDVIDAQGRSWWHAAQELNARREGRRLEAEHHANRKDLYHHRVGRLRKRKTYSSALGEIDRGLEGLLPGAERAAHSFEVFLVQQGFDQVDAESLVAKYRRVIVPRM